MRAYVKWPFAEDRHGALFLTQLPFETLCAANHTACRFAEKNEIFRSVRSGRRCAAALRFALFEGETR